MPLAIRVMPSFIRAILKLMSRPKRLSASRRCVNSCFLWTGAMASTELNLDDHLVFHNQVCPESHLNPGASIDDGNRLLPDRAQSSLLQLVRQYRFAGGFQQARPEAPMHAPSGS